MVDVLALRSEERRGSLRYAPGSWQSSFDPEISGAKKPKDVIVFKAFK